MAQRFLLVVFLSASALASGQTSPPVVLYAAALPDSPSALRTAQSAAQSSAPKPVVPALQTGIQIGTASISGQVEDFTGAAVPGALIQLDVPDRSNRALSADSAGAFHFGDLPPGTYRVSATAPNMGTYVSAEIRLAPGESLQLTKIALAVGSTHADVQVIATPTQIAAEQVHEQEQQRVFGILPNFYSSYIWDAAPLDSRQKYSLGLHSILDPFAFAATAITAGIQQERDTYPGFGTGPAAYGKRYGAAYATQAASRMIGGAILPSLFHQDPRYFYKGSGTTKSRALYAIRSAFVTRGDNGHLEPNYSYMIGAFASGSVAYGLHPASDRTVSTIFSNASIQIGTHAADELIREFVLRHLTPRVPAYKKGQPPASDKP